MRLTELGESAADIEALVQEMSTDGTDDGVSDVLERYGLDPVRVLTAAAVLGERGVKTFPGELETAFAGAFVAGLLQGLRIAEQRARGEET